MKRFIMIVLISGLGITSLALSHSGRTDKNGGHNCSAKSKKKGLCSGYHYHRSDDGNIYGHSHTTEGIENTPPHTHK